MVGNVKKSEYFEENGDKFLSRGHLAPDGDFIFGSWQFATYFYVNAAPQWQAVNGKNWLTVEKLVRKLGIKVSDRKVLVKFYVKFGSMTSLICGRYKPTNYDLIFIKGRQVCIWI